MDNFIVLGIVPGTDYQLTFAHWLMAAWIVLGIFTSMYIKRRQLVLKMRLVFAFYAMTRQPVRA